MIRRILRETPKRELLADLAVMALLCVCLYAFVVVAGLVAA
jgi:hypothetical protein